MAISNFRADFAPRLPGGVKANSRAAFRKSSTQNARQDMAEIIRRYETLIRHLENITPQILFNAVQPVRNRAAVYVPKKTGALAASERIQFGVSEGGKPMVSLTYGDESAWYAAIVHEMVGLNHESPTRAKYLQAALEEEMDAFLTSVTVDYIAAMT